MRRREFITLLGGAAVSWPLAARAEQPTMPVIGYLGGPLPQDVPARFAGLGAGLKESGFVEGQNVTIEYRSTKDPFDRFRQLAVGLVRRRVDLIFAFDDTAALAACGATETIPIVFAIGGNPAALRLVASFIRPGGNATGISFQSRTIMAKQLELLHQAVPEAAVIAALVNQANANAASDASELQRVARNLDLQLLILTAGNER
jgi:putative tryptophan/tyrosine transport system substrate-binding protein